MSASTSTAAPGCWVCSPRAIHAVSIKAMWQVKEVVRSIHGHRDPVLALEFVARLGRDLQDDDHPIEAHQLGRTSLRWRHQICAWHASGVSNGPTEAIDNLVKRINRVAFEIVNHRNYRIRALLYAGKPDWRLLPTIEPR